MQPHKSYPNFFVFDFYPTQALRGHDSNKENAGPYFGVEQVIQFDPYHGDSTDPNKKILIQTRIPIAIAM